MPSGSEPPATAAEAAVVSVERLTMAFGERVLQQDISFGVRPGSVFVVMGGSGSGKSTLLRHLVGLQTPAAGAVYYGQESFFAAPPERQDAIRASFGVMYQQGALWSSMTLGENVALPLQERAHLPPRDVPSWSCSSSRWSGSATSPTTIRPRSAAACASGRRSRAPWRSIPPSSSSTSRAPGSTR